MSDRIFKTPYPNHTPKSRKVYTKSSEADNASIVTTSSSDGEAPIGGNNIELSILAEYDEIIDSAKVFKSEYTNLENAYMQLVENAELLYESFKISREECLKLQKRLESTNHDYKDLEGKLVAARKLLDNQKKCTQMAEREREFFEDQLRKVKDIFARDRVGRAIPEDTLNKFAFLQVDQISDEIQPELSCIPEINSTGSLLSDLSYSKSEDGLDTSRYQQIGKSWKKHRHSELEAPEQPSKKRRSSGHKVVEICTTDTVKATTTLTMPKNGPITATSVVEAIPSSHHQPNVYAPSAPPSQETQQKFEHKSAFPSEMVFQSWARSPSKSSKDTNDNNIFSNRDHQFQKKTVVLPDKCGVCEKKLRFGRLAWKCKDCKNMCHEECKDKFPKPCIPVVNTPTNGNRLGLIRDYTGTTPPMVPPVIMHCVNEIERRNSNEVGLYRVSGSEKDVKYLKERFLNGKAAPNLKDVDIHVLCSVVKKFLRSLQEPLIPREFWKDFVRISENEDIKKMIETLSELPQPNRDTLAYLILHLQRISEKKEVKMTIYNLAQVFGPTIVGWYSSEDNQDILITETNQQRNVMTFLLNIPSCYWEKYVHVNKNYGSGGTLQQTPSTDSLLVQHLGTPKGQPKKRRFFPTPPQSRY